MGSFISKDGVLHPMKERVVITNESGKTLTLSPEHFNPSVVGPGEATIYNGPDRGAVQQLGEAKETTLGIDIHEDVDLIQRARDFGYKDLDEYLKVKGYNKEKSEAQFKLKASVIGTHELPKRIEESKLLGGGSPELGDKAYGGFGTLRFAKNGK